MVGYGSIVAIAFMVSEVKNPKKNVPKSVMIGMSIVVVIYALIILSTVGLISAEYLSENPGMRFIPLYAACFTKLSAYPWLAKVISIAAVLALITTMLTVLALTGRAIQAAAQGELLPAVLGKNSKQGTPAIATTVVALGAAILACMPSLTQQIVSLGALFACVTITINIISLYAARKKHIALPGSFRAPGGNILPAIALILILICYVPDIINGGWKIWSFTIGWYIVGLIIFRFSKANKSLK